MVEIILKSFSKKYKELHLLYRAENNDLCLVCDSYKKVLDYLDAEIKKNSDAVLCPEALLDVAFRYETVDNIVIDLEVK